MDTILILYPAYGTTSCHRISGYAAALGEVKLVLADDEPGSTEEDIFDEVMELPPPQYLSEAYDLMRHWCDKRRPDGIFMQSERGILLGSLLGRDFGLKAPSVEAAHLCANKYRQRMVLSKAGICNPQFALAETADDVHRFGREFGFPLILKCVISTMSRLVTPVPDDDAVDGAAERMRVNIAKSLDVARLAGFARTGKVDLGCDPARQFLVETYMPGEMVETDGIIGGDKPFTFGVTEQIQSIDPPFFIEGYLFPTECVSSRPVEMVSDAILKTIDLHYSGFSTEMRVRDNNVCLIEVNGRLGWDEGFSDLFRVRTHRERIAQVLQLALGKEPEVISDDGRVAALAYRCCYDDGIIDEMPTREELKALKRSNLTFGIATHRGARFVAPPNPDAYPHIVWALATHPESSRAAYKIARQAVDKLNVSLRKQNSP